MSRRLKQCTKCNEVKPKSEFHIRRRAKDGLQSWCIDCTTEYGRKRQEEMLLNNNAKQPSGRNATKEKDIKQLEVLKKMYEFNIELMGLNEEELQIFCENNAKLIQKLKDELGC